MLSHKAKLPRTVTPPYLLLTRMLVPNRRRLRAALDAVLDHHASWHAQIVLLQIGASEPGRLLHCFMNCHDSSLANGLERGP